MFRCITKLKGLAIDADSFKYNELSNWSEIKQQYSCLFITSNENTAKELENLYDGCLVYIIEKFRKLFAPSRMTHKNVLENLALKISRRTLVTLVMS